MVLPSSSMVRIFEVHADGGDVALRVCVIRESEQEAGLANARVPNEEELAQVVAVLRPSERREGASECDGARSMPFVRMRVCVHVCACCVTQRKSGRCTCTRVCMYVHAFRSSVGRVSLRGDWGCAGACPERTGPGCCLFESLERNGTQEMDYRVRACVGLTLSLPLLIAPCACLC